MEGRVVVVTGAARGLGLAYALACAGAGARVVVNDIDAAEGALAHEAVVKAGGEACVSDHSVSNSDDAEALMELGLARFGRLDGLVNNAGLLHIVGPEAETAATARRSIEVNLLGTVNCILAAMPRLQPGGAIVNVASGAALGMKGYGVYGATKAGVLTLTRSWAMDLDPARLAICAVSPVAVTRMFEATGRAPGNAAAPEDLAPVVVHLLAGGARTMHGRTLRVTADGLSWVEPPANTPSFATLEAWRPEDLTA